MTEIEKLKSENRVLRDRVAELDGLPQCSFCHARAYYKCCDTKCKAWCCGDHATAVGMTHIHAANPKDHMYFQRILCDRCNGEKTSNLTRIPNPASGENKTGA